MTITVIGSLFPKHVYQSTNHRFYYKCFLLILCCIVLISKRIHAKFHIFYTCIILRAIGLLSIHLQSKSQLSYYTFPATTFKFIWKRKSQWNFINSIPILNFRAFNWWSKGILSVQTLIKVSKNWKNFRFKKIGWWV
jgi:hypothetical protein